MSEHRVIKTYVWHGDKCFFVSTIERDSSALPVQDAPRFNETIVWDYVWPSERGEMIFQDWAPKGNITVHQRVVESLHRYGKPDQYGNS